MGRAVFRLGLGNLELVRCFFRIKIFPGVAKELIICLLELNNCYFVGAILKFQIFEVHR